MINPEAVTQEVKVIPCLLAEMYRVREGSDLTYFPCSLCMGSLPTPRFPEWLTRAAGAGRSVTHGEPTLTTVPEDPEPCNLRSVWRELAVLRC